MNKAESKYFNTANLMDEALMRLLEHKDYEYITVKEVCKKAGVNRSTFYLHYEKMDDLLAESLERLNQTFLSYFEGQTPEIISKIDESPLSELIFLTNDYLLPYLNFVFENKHVMRAAFRQPYALNAGSTVKKMYRHVFEPIMKRFAVPKEERPFYAAYYVNGIAAVLREGVNTDCEMPAEQVANLIVRLSLHDSKIK